jgi:hypothetical protein
LQRGRETEKRGCENRDRERKPEHATIYGDLLYARKVSRTERDYYIDEPVAQEQSDCSARERKSEAFSEQLSNDPFSIGSQCGANGDLVLSLKAA